MKLAFFDDYKLGVVVGDKVVDVSSAARGIKALGPQDVIRGVIEQWSTLQGQARGRRQEGQEQAARQGQASVRRCPSPRTSSAWR